MCENWSTWASSIILPSKNILVQQNAANQMITTALTKKAIISYRYYYHILQNTMDNFVSDQNTYIENDFIEVVDSMFTITILVMEY